MSADDVLRHARADLGRQVGHLKAFIAHPSVSGAPAHRRDVRRCAAWLAAHLRAIGLADARVVATGGHPLVFASWRGAPGRPTLLLYGHYDVQPAEPLAAWRTPPFAATVRGADLFGRGACDDKGQLFAFVAALHAWLTRRRRLPVNVLCLFEGEEEIGSPNLMPFVRRHREALGCDLVAMADSVMGPGERPAIIYGMRGMLGMELELRGPRRDLHSGSFGGIVHDPLQALCELLARLHDERGRIAIPGFYDRVRRVEDGEREALRRAAPTDADMRRTAAVDRDWGEPGWSMYERLALRPALTINGLGGGHAGAGLKGVIPARAFAKLSFRLVPDQDPREIEQRFRRHLATLVPPTVRMRLGTLSMARPATLDPRHPALAAAARACERAFGVPPALLRSGGTIPALHGFHAELGVPVVAFGFAPTDGGLHAPNEKLHLPTFARATAALILWLEALAKGDAERAPLPARHALCEAAP